MTRLTQKSFTGGELSPALYARNDLAKYESGLKTLKNGFVRAEGCISNRAGLEMICEAKDSMQKTRIIPFSFNTQQTYILELGNTYSRYIKNGGQIIYPEVYGILCNGKYTSESATGYYKYTIGEDIIYSETVLDVGSECFNDTALKEAYGTVEEIDIDNNTVVISNPEKVALRGNIVETQTPYATDDLFMLKYGQNADVLTICNNSYSARELSRISHYDWTLNDVVSTPQIETPKDISATWTGATSSNTTTYKYVITAVKDETYEESERSQETSAVGHLEAYWTTSEYMTINWKAVEGATEYNIYRSVNGIFGFIGTAKVTNFKDDKIEPDLTATAPIARDPFENDNNPACVNYFQQRKLFACLKNSPQALVTTQTGTDNNFNISRPLNASDSVTIKLSEREVNEIRHLIGLNDLIVLTSGAEWKLNGSDGTFSASSPPLCTPQSYYGCSHIQPCVSGNMVLFVQAGGSVVRDLGYEYVSDSYNGDELTIFANHLFENKQIVDMAYSKEPYRILWCVMSDGTLNALTYNKKQEVAGWHRHITRGEFESVAVIREGFEDVAYFVVKRIINGQTKRFIERMHSRLIDNAEDGFFVDCGLKATFDTPSKNIGGLSHLEGENVSVLADGGVVEGLKVIDGVITLPDKASKVVVGLPYEFELETLNIEGENTHGLKKIINLVNVKVDKSREDFYVVGQDGSEVQNPRGIDSVNDAGYLFNGDIPAYPFADYTEEASIKIKQKQPLPLTITSISAVVTVEEEDTDVQSEEK